MANEIYQPGDTVTVLALGREATVERQMPEADDYEVTLSDASEDEVATRYVGAGGLAVVKRATGKAANTEADAVPETAAELARDAVTGRFTSNPTPAEAPAESIAEEASETPAEEAGETVAAPEEPSA